MNPYVTYFAGINMRDGPKVIDSIPIGTVLELFREPNNPVDPNAIVIFYKEYKLGYIPAADAGRLAKIIGSGVSIGAELKRAWYEEGKVLINIKVFKFETPVKEQIEPIAVGPVVSNPVLAEPAQKPKTKWGKVALYAFGDLLAMSLINKCAENQKCVEGVQSIVEPINISSVDTSSGIAAEPVKPASKWDYYDGEDKMGSKVHTAAIAASDLLNFKFPYNGSSVATLIVRKNKGATDIQLRVSKGQFVINAVDGGTARVKFDGGSPVTFSLSGAAD
ncbi:HIRAN domain-containing protein, partial [Spirosoma endophyticum]